MTQIVENFNMNLLLTLRSSLKNISASDKPPKWVFFGKKKSNKEVFGDSHRTARIELLSQLAVNTRMCVISSKLTIKTPDRRQLHCFGVFIDNF